jgi:hypothetical protein
MGKSATAVQLPIKKGKVHSLKKLIRETKSSDEDEDLDFGTLAANVNSSRPWYTDFRLYLDTVEAKLPSRTSMVKWWGVCI